MRVAGFITFILPAVALLAQLSPGDEIRGKSIVEGKGACLSCHQIKDKGSRFGPDLTDIGARAGNAFSLRGRLGRGGRGAGPGRGAVSAVPDAGPASRAQAELERSLLEPDAEILPQNRTLRLVPRDGDPVLARLLNQDTFTLQVIDQKERLGSFAKASLREYSFMKNSPMPSYKDKLSPQELADVIAYLVSLKGVGK